MTIPKEIIEKAIEGGWSPYKNKTLRIGKIDHINGQLWVITEHLRQDGEWEVRDPRLDNFNLAEISLDPTFWQALGKSCGWFPAFYEIHHDYAHRLYDLILTQQPTDAFWEELLAQ